MNNEEMRELRIVLNALANQNGLLQWVNCWAVGKNEGGLYVSLFNDRLQYRVCTVYQERFRELPAFIRDNLPEDGDGIEISTDRTVLERKGQLHGCTPFQIARYSVGDGDKAAWRFSGVVRVAKPAPEPPPAAKEDDPLLERFNALGQDLYGAANWPEVARRNVSRISGGKTEDSAQLTVEQLERLINGLAKVKSKRTQGGSASADVDSVEERFNGATPEDRGALPLASNGASKAMRQRVAAHA